VSISIDFQHVSVFSQTRPLKRLSQPRLTVFLCAISKELYCENYTKSSALDSSGSTNIVADFLEMDGIGIINASILNESTQLIPSVYGNHIAVDNNDNIYIAQQSGPTVRVFHSPDYTTHNTIEHSLEHVDGLVVYENKLYICDGIAAMVKVFTLDGSHLFQFNVKAPFVHETNDIRKVCHMNISRGELFVCDFGQYTIQVFDIYTGSFIALIKMEKKIDCLANSICHFFRRQTCFELIPTCH
jgi:hypothetical protein